MFHIVSGNVPVFDVFQAALVYRRDYAGNTIIRIPGKSLPVRISDSTLTDEVLQGSLPAGRQKLSPRGYEQYRRWLRPGARCRIFFKSGIERNGLFNLLRDVISFTERVFMPAPTIATARIDDLMLRAIIGCNDWERAEKQDIVINVSMEFDARKAIKSDGIEDTLDYKAVKRRIIQEVEASSFQLLESLVHHVLSVVMGNERVRAASVRIDKPHALRFARSVSIEMHRRR